MPNITIPLAFLFFLGSAPVPEPWWNMLINGGIGAAVIGWFMWRDKQEREAREVERHETNKIQRDNTNALNLMTRGMMVQVMALKHSDETVADLACKIKEQADTHIGVEAK